MTIHVQCPTCGATYNIADESKNKTGRCGECRLLFRFANSVVQRALPNKSAVLPTDIHKPKTSQFPTWQRLLLVTYFFAFLTAKKHPCIAMCCVVMLVAKLGDWKHPGPTPITIDWNKREKEHFAELEKERSAENARLQKKFRLVASGRKGNETMECFVVDGPFTKDVFFSFVYFKQRGGWYAGGYNYIVVFDDEKFAVVPEQPNKYVYVSFGKQKYGCVPDSVKIECHNLGGFEKNEEAMKHIKATFFISPFTGTASGVNNGQFMVYYNTAFEMAFSSY